MEYFKERRDNEHYHRAFMVAVLAGFFLVGDFEAMDPKMIDITTMLSTDNPVPMILAKTLNGLDDLRDDAYQYFEGSPLLLQVTLYTFPICLLLASLSL